MRIISGKAKGLRLTAPPGKSLFIRPTSDRCREAVFSILADSVTDARILDLYAGTGALGLEAVSRGADSAVFVDNDLTSLAILRKNSAAVHNSLASQGASVEMRIVKHDIRKGLHPLLQKISENTPCFDIIFIDPPYDKGLALQALTSLDRYGYLSTGGTIVVEDKAKLKFPDQFLSFQLIDQRKYGDSGFWIYSK